MTLSNNETRFLIHRDLLVSANGREKLLNYFQKHLSIPNHTIFKGVKEDGDLDTVDPTYAQQKFSLSDTSFQHFVTQKAIDEYVYASYETFLMLIE